MYDTNAAAIAQVRDLYATRREGLEEQKRRAEEELKALESKLEGLRAGNEPRIDPVAVDLSSTTPNGVGPASGPEPGFEEDWYEKLILEAETEKPEKAE